jgi:hypothetical protein
MLVSYKEVTYEGDVTFTTITELGDAVTDNCNRTPDRAILE